MFSGTVQTKLHTEIYFFDLLQYNHCIQIHYCFITVEARLKGIGKMENAMDQEWKQEVDGYTEESGHKDSKVNIINKTTMRRKQHSVLIEVSSQYAMVLLCPRIWHSFRNTDIESKLMSLNSLINRFFVQMM